MTEPQAGDAAPDFTLPDDEGNPFTLSEEVGKAHIILYFYPKDDTPGCRVEAQAFRDEVKVFFGLEATIIGVSAGSVQSKADFKRRYALNFRLLSDETKEVCKRYGVMGLLGIAPKRVTFIIGKDGRIRRVYSNPLPKGHLEAAREELFRMREEEQARTPPAAPAAP